METNWTTHRAPYRKVVVTNRQLAIFLPKIRRPRKTRRRRKDFERRPSLKRKPRRRRKRRLNFLSLVCRRFVIRHQILPFHIYLFICRLSVSDTKFKENLLSLRLWETTLPLKGVVVFIIKKKERNREDYVSSFYNLHYKRVLFAFTSLA